MLCCNRLNWKDFDDRLVISTTLPARFYDIQRRLIDPESIGAVLVEVVLDPSTIGLT